MPRLYALSGQAFFWAGIGFSILEFVYGYVFGVWNEVLFAVAIAQPVGHIPSVTKFGELMLFGFLAVACFLASVSATTLGRATP